MTGTPPMSAERRTPTEDEFRIIGKDKSVSFETLARMVSDTHNGVCRSAQTLNSRRISLYKGSRFAWVCTSSCPRVKNGNPG